MTNKQKKILHKGKFVCNSNLTDCSILSN